MSQRWKTVVSLHLWDLFVLPSVSSVFVFTYVLFRLLLVPFAQTTLRTTIVVVCLGGQQFCLWFSLVL